MDAGTLHIEILTNLSRLQTEMQQIQRSVGTMVSGVGQSVRVANDNFASIARAASDVAGRINDITGVTQGSMRRSAADIAAYGAEMDRLRAKFNPLFAIGQTYKAQLEEIRNAHRVGAISTMEMGAAVDRLKAQTQNAVAAQTQLHPTLQAVTTSAGAQKQGMQQLGYQLGDAATMFSSGATVAQIFGTQLGQTLQAVQLMTGGTSGLAAFLGGPWGIALSVAAIAMVPFIGKLFDSESAARNAAEGYRTAADEARGLAGAMNNLKLTETYGKLNKARERAMELEGQIMAVGPLNMKAGYLKDNFKDKQELQGLRWEIVKLENVTKLAETENERLNKSMAATARSAISSGGAVAGHTRATQASIGAGAVHKEIIDEQAEAYARLAKEASSAAIEIAKALAASLEGSLSQMQDEIARGTSPWLQAANDNAKATANWNTELQETIRLLDGLGGFGSVLGNIGAIFEAIGSGNWQNVNGPLGIIGKSLGGVLNNTYTTGMDDNGRWIKSFGEILTEKLDGVFGEAGSFKKVLQSAGVGMAAGQLINGSKNSGLGSAIGGALGDKIGSKVFKNGFETIAKGLGDFAGPLGSIVGGVLGGVVGSLFKKTTSGYASVTNKGVTSGGNDASLAASSKTSGSGIQSAIAGIADQLGGTVGDYAVAIGKRSSGWIKVSASGNGQAAAGKKVTSDIVYNGKDEAEALRIAVLNAIQDGAIQGVRAGTQALLSKNGDIEAQLAKALQFENVFTTLKQKTDPLGYALGQIDRQFTKLKTVFDEAGATAADYAQLEQLIALQRQEAMDEEAARQLDKLNERRSLEVRLMEAQGNAAGALALQRTIERSETEASLRGLMDQIYAAEDLAAAQQAAATAAEAAQAKFRSFATDLRKFANELTGSDGVASYRGSRAQLMATGALAAAGNVDALSNLNGVAQAFIDLAKDQSSTAAQYQREVAMVRSYLNTAIAVADGGTITGLAGASGTAEQIAAANGQVNASLLTEMQAVRAEVSAQRAEVRAANEALVVANNKMARLQERWDRGGSIAVVTDDDRPIKTVAA